MPLTASIPVPHTSDLRIGDTPSRDVDHPRKLGYSSIRTSRSPLARSSSPDSRSRRANDVTETRTCRFVSVHCIHSGLDADHMPASAFYSQTPLLARTRALHRDVLWQYRVDALFRRRSTYRPPCLPRTPATMTLTPLGTAPQHDSHPPLLHRPDRRPHLVSRLLLPHGLAGLAVRGAVRRESDCGLDERLRCALRLCRRRKSVEQVVAECTIEPLASFASHISLPLV